MSETSQPAGPRGALGRAALWPAIAWPRWAFGGIVGGVRPGSALLGFAAALVVLIATVTAGVLWHFRVQALGEAEPQIRNLNGVLAEQTARSVEHVDVILRTIVERVESERSGTADAGLAARMRELLAATPQIRTMMIADRSGMMTQSTIAATTAPVVKRRTSRRQSPKTVSAVTETTLISGKLATR